MTRKVWATLLGLYGVASVLAAILLGTAIPFCSSPVTTGRMSDACVESWQAARPWWLKLFDTPLGALAVFVALAAVTWLVATIVERRSHRRT
jgi:hypothetical protein